MGQLGKRSLILCILLLAACTGYTGQSETTVEDDERLYFEDNRNYEKWHVYRYHDNELRVTCWILGVDTSHGGRGGISCIPDEQVGREE